MLQLFRDVSLARRKREAMKLELPIYTEVIHWLLQLQYLEQGHRVRIPVCQDDFDEGEGRDVSLCALFL